MSTHDLGELGSPRDPVDITFSWFGESIRVAPNAGDLALIDFLEKARGIDNTDNVSSMIETRAFLRTQIDPRDWQTFTEAATANNQQFEDLLRVARSIVEACARFPTGRPADSSAGLPNTGPKLRDDSSSVEYAMAQLDGRPDLKMAIWQAQQAKLADAA